jgi:hypothetical protein
MHTHHRTTIAASLTLTLHMAAQTTTVIPCGRDNTLYESSTGAFSNALGESVFVGVTAQGRLHRALWVNHRYWFTTWRWGKVLASMMVIGAVLKLSMSA